VRSSFLTNNEFLRTRLLTQAGVIKKPTYSLSALRSTQWSTHFEQLMRNRLIMGALRYGLLHAIGKPQYDRLKAMKDRLDQYKQTGNDELLVDVANLSLLEFEEGKHPLKHWKSQDDSTHVEAVK
jgi:hypothetical protein